MKKNQLVIVVGIVILLIIGFIFTNKKGGKTAKAAYQIALAEVKKSNPDAFLVDINAHVNNKGESDNWYGEFYSPSSDKIFRMIIKSGRVTEVQEKKATKKNPVGENWIDNDKIMGIALKECGQVTEDEYFVSLDNINKLKWSVSCLVGENKTLYADIDAITGEFIKTRKAGIGW